MNNLSKFVILYINTIDEFRIDFHFFVLLSLLLFFFILFVHFNGLNYFVWLYTLFFNLLFKFFYSNPFILNFLHCVVSFIFFHFFIFFFISRFRFDFLTWSILPLILMSFFIKIVLLLDDNACIFYFFIFRFNFFFLIHFAFCSKFSSLRCFLWFFLNFWLIFPDLCYLLFSIFKIALFYSIIYFVLFFLISFFCLFF